MLGLTGPHLTPSEHHKHDGATPVLKETKPRPCALTGRLFFPVLFLLTAVDQTIATSWKQKAKVSPEHQVKEYGFEYILQQASAYVI
jgi:hypothetical protein